MKELSTSGDAVGSKKKYQRPELKTWGTVADLTLTGQTNPGGDAKSGSVLSPGG